jgi:hypothetical protein
MWEHAMQDDRCGQPRIAAMVVSLEDASLPSLSLYVRADEVFE